MSRRNNACITIAGRPVGHGHPLFVIAEIGLNHGGSVERAIALVDAAADAGVSAIKLQTLSAQALVAPDAPAPAHVRAESMREFFAAFELDEVAHRAVIGRARARGLAVLATPLSEAAVGMLSRIGIDAFKIASGDVTWPGLIRRSAATGKPLVISTGMANLAEIGDAAACARRAGATEVALLHCVSAYPVPNESQNLEAVRTLAEVFGVPVGLSDHGSDTFAAPLAIALGASLYERHIVLEVNDGSIDAEVSSTPAEFATLVATAARASDALGSGEKVCLAVEAVNKRASRRALYAARHLAPGDRISEADVIALRPAVGLPVSRLPELVGVRVARDIEEGMPFLERDLVGGVTVAAAVKTSAGDSRVVA